MANANAIARAPEKCVLGSAERGWIPELGGTGTAVLPRLHGLCPSRRSRGQVVHTRTDGRRCWRRHFGAMHVLASAAALQDKLDAVCQEDNRMGYAEHI